MIPLLTPITILGLGIYAWIFGDNSGPFLLPNLIILFLSGIPVMVLHELGHGIIARLLKIPVYLVRLGLGRELFRRTLGGVPVSINTNLQGGITILKSTPKEIPRWKLLLIFAGGILVQIILALFLWLVFHPNLSQLFNGTGFAPAAAIFLHNGVLLLLTLIPLNIQLSGIQIPNDSMKILKLLFHWPQAGQQLLNLNQMMVGSTQFTEGQYNEAVSTFAERLKESPTDPQALSNLIAAHLRLMNLKEAEDLLYQLRDQHVSPKHPLTLYQNLTWFYLLKHDPQSLRLAALYAQKAYQENPKSFLSIGLRGCMLIETGYLQRGLKLLRKVTHLTQPPDESFNPPAFLMYAAYAHDLNDDPKTSEKYQNAVLPHLTFMAPDSLHLVRTLQKKLG